MKALFVCTGNTCRSPMAQFLFNAAVRARGLEGWEARSCGLAADPDSQVSPAVPRVLAQRGIEGVRHAPQAASEPLLDWADHIYAMARGHLERIKAGHPAQRAKTELFLEAAGLGKRDVPDPIGQDEGAYARCRDLIEEGVRNIIEKHAPTTSKPRS